MKNTQFNKIFLIFAAITIVASLLGIPQNKVAAQNAGDDIAGEFRITITPESTGNLQIRYDFINYCAGIDYPDGPYTVGIPKKEFEVLEDSGMYGSSNGLITKVKPRIDSDGSKAALTLSHRPQKGECWDMFFTVRQSKMAYDNGDKGISVQFLNPYWKDENDFFYAKKFNIVWNLKGLNPTKFEPNPNTKTDENAIYTWENVRLNSQFANIMIWFPKEAFPELKAANVSTDAPFKSGGVKPAQPVQNTQPTESSQISLSQLICYCLIAILVILLILYVFWVISRLADGTPSTGHYHGSSSTVSVDPTIFLGEVAEALGDAITSVDVSGGGGGKGGGGGTGCACACAGCACACAGGGR